jgi:hypothetical protein
MTCSIHLDRVRPCADEIPRLKALPPRVMTALRKRISGLMDFTKRRALLKCINIIDRVPNRLIREVQLVLGNLLFLDANLLDAADFDERRSQTVLHTLNQRRHRHE